MVESKYKSHREMFTKEWFPSAMALGITWEQFWDMNPTIIMAHQAGHRKQIEEQNYLMYLHNVYTRDALLCTVGNMFRGKGSKPISYPEKPYELGKAEDTAKILTEEEKKEQTEALFRSLRLLQANFNLSHGDGEE